MISRYIANIITENVKLLRTGYFITLSIMEPLVNSYAQKTNMTGGCIALFYTSLSTQSLKNRTGNPGYYEVSVSQSMPLFIKRWQAFFIKHLRIAG